MNFLLWEREKRKKTKKRTKNQIPLQETNILLTWRSHGSQWKPTEVITISDTIMSSPTWAYLVSVGGVLCHAENSYSRHIPSLQVPPGWHVNKDTLPTWNRGGGGDVSMMQRSIISIPHASFLCVSSLPSFSCPCSPCVEIQNLLNSLMKSDFAHVWWNVDISRSRSDIGTLLPKAAIIVIFGHFSGQL